MLYMLTMQKSRQGFQRKIIDMSTLMLHRAAAKQGGKTVVQCHGCFDIVHPGHIRYLQFAKQQGDILIVSLTGDPHIGKGEGRPYVPQELRAENLAALEFVDWVYINPTPTAVDLLGTVKPDIYIKGREYEHNHHPGFLKERAAVENYGGRVIFSSGEVIYSSSHIIENYAQRLDLEQEKLSLFCKRYDIQHDAILELMDAVVDRPYLIIGDMVLDRYQYCDASDLSADGPMMSLVPLEQRDFLGGAAMVARHLAGLGAEPTLIASFGRDDASDTAIDTLESLGVHVLPVRNRKKIATKTRFVVDTQKLFQLDEAAATPMDSANEKWLTDEVRRLATADGTVMLYDAGLGVLGDSVCTEVVNTSKTMYGKFVGGTAGSRGRLSRLAQADLLVSTERGVRVATRDHEQGITSLAYRLLSSTSAKSLLVPLGKRGLLCFDHFLNAPADAGWEGKLRSEYLASPVNGAVDKLGCLEALLAVSGALIGAGANVHQAAYVGLAASILEGRQMGHQPIDGHELRQLLESRPELAS
jgi:rfaE bifunctional protein nucleotidyltransferase chain/domain